MCKADLSARLTMFFTSQKLKDDITTSYELIQLQNNCHQLISRLRMSGHIFAPSNAFMLWEEVKGREHTDRHIRLGWN
jgi:hypothetical protein